MSYQAWTKNGFKFVKDANKYYMSPNPPGKGFPKQILSPSTTSPLLFLKVKSHLSLLPVHLHCHPHDPPAWGRAGEAGLLSLTPPPGAHTHLIGLKRDVCYLIHLLIKSIEPGKFSDRGNLTHVHDIHTGFIIAKHLPKGTERMLSTLISDGRGGRKGWHHQAGHPGLMTHLACLFPGAQPPRTPPCPGVWLGKFLTCHISIKLLHYLNLHGKPASRKAYIRPWNVPV